MIFGTLRFAYRLVTLAVVAFVFFGVPLGEYTLYEHARRIFATEEATELGQELHQGLREVGARVGERLDGSVRVEVDRAE